MNRERELLERCLDEFQYHEVPRIDDLIREIQQQLKQPEPEQEPVAWCQMVEGKVQDLLTSFEMKDWLYDKSWIPLYTAPLKREPLTPQQISEGNQSMLNVTREAFKQGVIFAEKAHGIGGGE